MNPNRRFEDKLSVEDLLKKPAKEIQIMTYLQAVKTNGTVSRHDKCITTLEDEMKTKIGWKVFVVGASVITAIILTFSLINLLGG